jgi:hypothetical protein
VGQSYQQSAVYVTSTNKPQQAKSKPTHERQCRFGRPNTAYEVLEGRRTGALDPNKSIVLPVQLKGRGLLSEFQMLKKVRYDRPA